MNERIRIFFYVIFAITFATIIRMADIIDIHPDEAYYFSWSRYLQSGYLDHPPAIAFLIKLSSILFNGNFRVRGLNIIISLLSLLFISKSIRLFTDNNKTVYTALIITLLSPAFITMSVIATPDTPLIFFTSGYIYFTLRSLDSEKIWSFSILSGIFLGLSMLSKYTAFLIPVSLFFFYLRYKRDSNIVKRAFTLPLITSIIVYLPNLIYNIQNGYTSYLFQLSHALKTSSINPIKTFIPFLLSQIFILSPFVFIHFLIKITEYAKRPDPREVFLFNLTIVPLLLFTLLSLFNHVEANWPALSYIPLIILTAPRISDLRVGPIISLIYQIAVFVIIILHIEFSILPIKPEFDPLTQIKDWEKTYCLIRENIPPNRTVVTFRYQLSSILYYYSQEKISSLCLDRRFVRSEIGLKEAEDWVMIDFFPARTATDIALNICPERMIRIPLVISENMNIIRRIDIIYCDRAMKRSE